MDALCKFHDFATSMEFEVDLIIPSCSVIHGFFKTDERFSDLARQDETDISQHHLPKAFVGLLLWLRHGLNC